MRFKAAHQKFMLNYFNCFKLNVLKEMAYNFNSTMATCYIDTLYFKIEMGVHLSYCLISFVMNSQPYFLAMS